MRYALHVILIVRAKSVSGSLNGFGVVKHTWQKEGIFSSHCSKKRATLDRLLLKLEILFIPNISDYYHIKRQLESELVEVGDGQRSKSFLDLPKAEQQAKLKDRLKKYCQKVSC